MFRRVSGHVPLGLVFRTRISRVVVTAGAAAGLIAAGIATSAGGAVATGARPIIQAVTFSGTHGSGQPSPTITITGAHFGSTAPAGTSNNTTSCGPYTANGDKYGSKLYFEDDTNFEAGFSNTAGADCVGIVVVSWTSTRVVLRFGNAYGSFDHWYLTNGDGYGLSLKTALFGGSVSGLT